MEADQVANVIAAGALALSALGFLRGESVRRKSVREGRRADEAAEKSAEAAQRSAAAQEKLAEQFSEFLSRQERRDQRQWGRSQPGDWPVGRDVRGGGGPWAGPMPGAPSGPVVHWTVDKNKGGRHTLTNLGRATAYQVMLNCENAVRFDGPEMRDIAMGESVEFLAIGSLQTGTPELLVTWQESRENDERTEWRRPLP